MASEYVDADVPALARLVLLMDEWYATRDVKLLSAIERLERSFGLTPMARRALEWDVAESVDDAVDERSAASAVDGRFLQALEGGRS